jgi:hypothetical protein
MEAQAASLRRRAAERRARGKDPAVRRLMQARTALRAVFGVAHPEVQQRAAAALDLVQEAIDLSIVESQ